MKFYTKYDRPGDSVIMESPNVGEILVEIAGYVPANVKIEELIYAGQRLKEYRQEQFDFAAGKDVPDDFIDPTRSGDFDMADASAIQVSLTERYKKFEAEQKEKERKKKEQEEAEAKDEKIKRSWILRG